MLSGDHLRRHFQRSSSRFARPLAVLGLLLSTATHADTAPAPCRVPGIAHEVLCGSVQRPLDPARPTGIRFEVNYVVVPAKARRKHPDPVLMLAGGPGQSAVRLAPSVLALFSRLNNRRDLVFIDQRGTGRSAPLECAEPRDEALASQNDPQRQRALLAECRGQLARLPHVGSPDGLRFFTTTIAMQDVDAVRRQLGAAQVNLIGASYGTRAALELLRQYPATVRRSVLDGVAPPDMALPASMSTDSQAAFDALLAACDHEAACARSYPRLRSDWAALLAGLPRTVQVTDPRSGRRETLVLHRDMLVGAIRAPLYVPAIGAALPRAITEAAAGRYEALAGLNAMVSPRHGRRSAASLAAGMHFSVVCAEDLPQLAGHAETPGRDFGNISRTLYEQLCADWPRGEVPPAFYTIAPSATPVLLLSGGLDPVTPPRHGARVAKALGAKAIHRMVPNAGHGLMGVGCVRDLLFRFIDAEDDDAALALDTGCVESIPRPPAYLPPSPEAAR